uniref:Obscurin like cytoskeletal adaptor 1a n=1 Tax=Mastacembelus armatus TaxID=205130 RepID=A0A7N8XYW8_9TELE
MNKENKWTSKLIARQEEVDLTTDSKPRFLIKPLSLRVDRGEDVAFSCKIWGTPLPQVTWEKDGKKLNDIFESSHFILAGAVLLVEPVPERKENIMSLDSLTNSQWSPKHRGGRLSLSRVTEEPPVNVSKVKKFAVAEGKHAKFRCLVTGKPKPEIIWKKDGIPLEPGRRHLIFEDREVQDTGLYVCAASNALGNTLNVSVNVRWKSSFLMIVPGEFICINDMLP